ncbi:MAG: metallophosphoesterase [Oscillospiraceae bacterium]|jgi:predicted MPP superfamily phosphohydrolase|nr:metallophosphoesterase [Oscillospiraceae bacterium]
MNFLITIFAKIKKAALACGRAIAALPKAVAISVTVCAVLVLLVVIITYFQQQSLSVTYYELEEEKIENPVRIVFISDLHMREFGAGNSRLIEKIKEQAPDIIAVGGDFCNKTEEYYGTAIEILPKLMQIAPTYYTLGNHELTHQNSAQMVADIAATGVNLLNNQTEEILVNGNKIAVCGLNMFTHVDDGFKDDNYDDFMSFMKDFAAYDSYRLLLCHFPHYSSWYFEKDKFSFDFELMISGHTHGGEIILPFAGGLFAPEQGFFPKYDYGLFNVKNYKMIVSRGLGDSHYMRRVNNPPEIVVVDLK